MSPSRTASNSRIDFARPPSCSSPASPVDYLEYPIQTLKVGSKTYAYYSLPKLGERLAFERTGVRLYEAVIVKATSATGARPALLDTLREIQAQELEHMNIVREAIETLGGDPTTMTPCADVAGVKALGVLQVVTDPRTTLAQALNAILAIELEDNAAWELLIELAQKGGHPLIAKRFAHALEQEEMHLARVRDAVRQDLLEEVS